MMDCPEPRNYSNISRNRQAFKDAAVNTPVRFKGRLVRNPVTHTLASNAVRLARRQLAVNVDAARVV